MGLPTVELSAFASVVLVAWVGFAAHRASLCTVRAVAEILSSGTAWMLASFAKAALWTLAVSGLALLLNPLSGAPVQQTLPHAAALAGGLVFGIGGAVIPSGNDTLILAAIPTLSPWSLATYIALLAGVAAALLAMRAFTGLQLRVDCTGDRCH